MTVTNILEKRIQYRIKKSRTSSFMLCDFQDLSDKDQIMRALRKLIAKNILIKVGQGVYVRARLSKATNTPIPEKSLQEIALEVMKKLKIKVVSTDFDLSYNKSETTQIPTGRTIFIKGRICRKIGFNGNYINYAKAN